MTLLRINELNLVGADRRITFRPGFNVISGDIASGKTTLVRLLRALLGNKPRHLPPEASTITHLRGVITIGSREYSINRPFVSTLTAEVDVTGPEQALRLPASRATKGTSTTFAAWMLQRLNIPAVEVPTARSKETASTTAVTINDWLSYCFVPGDEIDVMVFGHKDPFRDIKRRYVFELNYGLFDAEAAELQAQLRKLELRAAQLESQEIAAAAFLAHTPFASIEDVASLLSEARRQLELLAVQQPSQELDEPTMRLREQFLTMRDEFSSSTDALRHASAQLDDLQALLSDLRAQAGRLNRAIVSTELLSDIDFVVCPRCGQDVDRVEREEQGNCRLCLQHVEAAPPSDAMLKELDRVYAQIAETEDLVQLRAEETKVLERSVSERQIELERIGQRLDIAASQFVSNQSDVIAASARRQARLESDLERYSDYLELYQKQAMIATELSILMDERNELLGRLETANLDSGYENLRELERQFAAYLERLHAPLVHGPDSVRLNKKTFLPEINGRSFDTLSSQGLATLVNVAHALAHHTVSIRLGLPLPGLLVLDGLSSNLGHEDFDAARVEDMYSLIRDVGAEYAENLQIIVLDNDPPSWAKPFERLRLSQESRLITRVAIDGQTPPR